MFIHFPLKTDTLISENEIDQLLSIEPGDSLEVNINRVITEQSECIYRKANVAVFTKPIIMKTQIMERNLINSKIIEGGCSNTDVESLRALESDMEDMKKHIAKTSDAHGGIGSGGGTVGTLTKDQLAKLLQDNTLKCEPIKNNSTNETIQEILDITPSTFTTKMDLTNPLAVILGGLISILGTYIVVTAGYTEIFKRLYNRVFKTDLSMTLFYMKIIEGFIPFILFVAFVAIYTKNKDPTTATIIMISWISYSLIIGVFKSGIIRTIVVPPGQLEAELKKEHYIITNMLMAYPLWPLVSAYKLVNRPS
jgi:hypothetical protein